MTADALSIVIILGSNSVMASIPKVTSALLVCFSLLTIASCGGGGGAPASGGGSPTPSPAPAPSNAPSDNYSGLRTPVAFSDRSGSESSEYRVFSQLDLFFGFTAEPHPSLPVSARALEEADDEALARYRMAYQRSLIQGRAVVDESEDCALGGSISTTGEILTDGTGTLTYTYNDCVTNIFGAYNSRRNGSITLDVDGYAEETRAFTDFARTYTAYRDDDDSLGDTTWRGPYAK
jgi:hypothetical protein